MIFDRNFLRHLAGGELPERRQYASTNPRPPGQIDAGSATHQLLTVLATKPQLFMSYGNIHRAMATPKNLHWSLRYARHMGWIEVTGDLRSARYLSYRITKLGMRLFEEGST